MFSAFWFLASASAAIVCAATLDDVCTTSYARTALPADSFYNGITIDSSSVVTTTVKNANISSTGDYPAATIDYCNVTFAYSHNGRDDKVHVTYWLPTPDMFQNRYLSTGGGGFAISSGSRSLPAGIIYGAVAGTTDGGFGSFNTNSDAVFLIKNGTVNWQSVYMFGYQAHHELTTLGKEFTKRFFKSNGTRLYAYYQGCSEGGREGWSQIQRYANDWDGAITGAPAFRFSHQQVQHLYSNIVEQTLGYYPPPCELQKILNETITACDPLDGKVDGVVARSDLCKLHFNINSTIGKAYSCAANPGGTSPPMIRRQMQTNPTPAQNGTVTAKGAAVAQEIINGLRDTKGRRVYFSYQPAATFADAATKYNSATRTWELSINGMGAEFVARYLQLVNSSTLPNLQGVTYDTLRDWMLDGWQRYEDTLQTTWPDLTPFQEAGGKVIHFHGESDDSIPAASSVRYYESVRKIMYPSLSLNDSTAELNKWYRLFLVPGAGHCGPSTTQPNGPFPQSKLATLIDWVEKGIEPQTLNATVLAGPRAGEKGEICSWPLRPNWNGNGTNLECGFDKESFDTWNYDLNAFKVPVY